jgi:HAD superfamily hydrolase (TIGR01549 family)
MKIAFWDWTGAIADESKIDEAVCKSMEEACAKKHKIPLKEAEKKFKNHLKSLENTWQWHDYVLHGRALGVDWKRNQEINLKKLVLLPNARETLKYVRDRGYKNVLATNAIRDVILLRADYVNLADLFDDIVASSDVKALKSEGKHFEYILEKLNGNASSSFSIGDNPIQDINPAKRLGLKTIYCDFGEKLTYYHSEHISNNHKEPITADYIIKNLLEIKGIIK